MGLSSYECPVCKRSILHEGLTDQDPNLDEGWSHAALVLPDGVFEGAHDGYGNIDGVNFYALAVLGDPDDLDSLALEKDEKRLVKEWWDSATGVNSKKYPIKMYHYYCWENSGKPNFKAAKASKSAVDQGHFINEVRYKVWPPPGKKANPAKEGEGVEDGEVVRFEFTEGSSNKFWEYTDQGDGNALVRWGRIGTQGQSQITPLDKAVKKGYAKEKKGYYPVSASLKTDLRRKLQALGIKTYRNHQGRSFIRRQDVKAALKITAISKDEAEKFLSGLSGKPTQTDLEDFVEKNQYDKDEIAELMYDLRSLRVLDLKAPKPKIDSSSIPIKSKEELIKYMPDFTAIKVEVGDDWDDDTGDLVNPKMLFDNHPFETEKLVLGDDYYWSSGIDGGNEDRFIDEVKAKGYDEAYTTDVGLIITTKDGKEQYVYFQDTVEALKLEKEWHKWWKEKVADLDKNDQTVIQLKEMPKYQFPDQQKNRAAADDKN